MKRGWMVTFAGLGVNLALGVLYSWGVFSSALREQGWSATESQIPYMTACAVFATLMVPGGRIQDKLGPKLVLLLAAVLTGIGGLVRDMTGTYHVSYWVAAGLCMVGIVLSLMTKAPTQMPISNPDHEERLRTEQG
jgi:MFS family permease